MSDSYIETQRVYLHILFYSTIIFSIISIWTGLFLVGAFIPIAVLLAPRMMYVILHDRLMQELAHEIEAPYLLLKYNLGRHKLYSSSISDQRDQLWGPVSRSLHKEIFRSTPHDLLLDRRRYAVLRMLLSRCETLELKFGKLISQISIEIQDLDPYLGSPRLSIEEEFFSR